MPVKHARHIALTAPLAAWVDELVARGDFTSASDLVRTALRQMQERDAARTPPIHNPAAAGGRS